MDEVCSCAAEYALESASSAWSSTENSSIGLDAGALASKAGSFHEEVA